MRLKYSGTVGLNRTARPTSSNTGDEAGGSFHNEQVTILFLKYEYSGRNPLAGKLYPLLLSVAPCRRCG
jgi:hypothetical protein